MRGTAFIAALLYGLLVLVQGVRICRVPAIRPSNFSNSSTAFTLPPSFNGTTNSSTIAPTPAPDQLDNNTVTPGANGTKVPSTTAAGPTTPPTPTLTNSSSLTNTTKVPVKTPKPTQTNEVPTTPTVTVDSVRRLAATTKAPTTTASTGVPRPTITDMATIPPTSEPTTTPATTESPMTTTAAPNATTTTASPQTTATPATSIAPASSNDLVCDEAFYNQWIVKNITCNGNVVDVAQAVAAASCVAYTDVSACRPLCSFPSCENGAWVYGSDAGFLSSMYKSIDIAQLVPSLASYNPSNLVGSTCQKPAFDTGVQECVCGGNSWGGNSNQTNKDPWAQPDKNPKTPAPSNQQVPQMSLSQSTATATIAVTTVAVVSSTVMGSTTAATTAVASSSAMLVTLDVVQFGSLINQLPLKQKTEALTSIGTQMKYAVFNFIEVGPGEPEGLHGRKLAESCADDGICQYAVTLGISKYNLFVTTLVGIFIVVAAILVLFGLVTGVATLAFPSRGYASEWYHHLVGAMVVLGLASQYAIGVTATYQIYLAYSSGSFVYSFYLAIFSLLFLAIGIIVFGVYIIRKHEQDLLDVDQIGHQKKAVNRRYGALYDEYTFENRFFFAPKMLLALLCGMTTGAVFLHNSTQVILVLVFHILFLVHLERCQPFQTPFMQHSMSLITVMKIITLVLSIFLISSVQGLSIGFHDAVSKIIVAIQLLVLFGLMVRQVILMYQRYKAMKEHQKQEKDDSALKPLSTEQFEHMKLGRL